MLKKLNCFYILSEYRKESRTRGVSHPPRGHCHGLSLMLHYAGEMESSDFRMQISDLRAKT